MASYIQRLFAKLFMPEDGHPSQY